MISVKKALACQAYDILVNGIPIDRRDTLRDANAEGKRLAKKAGVEFEGRIMVRSDKKDRSQFESKHKAIPTGWNWGEKV